jgi:uncharacterized protein (TIGR02598 family)
MRSVNLPPSSTRTRNRLLAIAGFSLIEISVSLSVIGFAFVGVLGLMANGIDQFRTAMDSSVTAQIAQRILSEVQQTEFRTLIDAEHLGEKRSEPEFTFRAPRIDAAAFRYFDEQGQEIAVAEKSSATELGRAIYQVNVRIRPHAEIPADEINRDPLLAQVTVQVALNQGAVNEIDRAPGPNENLFVSAPTRPVYTYSALVGRNE